MATPDYTDLPELTISLGAADTPHPTCLEYVDFLFPIYTRSMDAYLPGFSHYGTGTSVGVIPDTYEQWLDDVGQYTRRRLRRAQRDGYTFGPIERDDYLDDIFEINTSMAERQGREMDENYRKRPGPFGPLPEQPCPRHRLCTYGVLDKDGKLVAYTWVYVTGEMFLTSTLLGHGDHLNNGVMFMLIGGVVDDLISTAGVTYFVYERHWSGTEGLRFFKEQVGLRPHNVHWLRGDERPPTTAEKLAETWRPRLEAARVRGRQVGAGATRLKKRLRAKAGRVKRRVLGTGSR
jgi:hypothetical protein